MARDKKKKIGRDGEVTLGEDADFSVSIGQALGLTRETPADEKTAVEKIPKKSPAPGGDADATLASATQATLHREASGRGGRVVTVVSLKPAPNAQTAELLAKAMRKGLGCGSHVENGKIVLQGDIQDRAEGWLAKRGVKKIVMGN